MSNRIFRGQMVLANTKVMTAAGNYTITNEAELVVNKASGAATTVNLPNGTYLLPGTVVEVKDGKGDATTNNITIDPYSTQTIDGASTLVINTNYGAARLLWNGTQWNLLSKVGGDSTVNSQTINGSLAVSGNIEGSVAAPAAAGSSQSDGTALTADNNFVTGADGTKGVVLPTAVAGMRILVKSVTGGSALKVYPATGAAINALSANAAISMASLTSAIFVAASATQWYTCPTVPS